MLTRRRFVAGAAAGGAIGWLGCRKGPAISSSRPRVTHGIQVGDVQLGADGRGSGVVWARCDEPARLIVEWDTTERFAAPRRVAGGIVDPTTDLTGTVALHELPAAQTIWYRARFEREAARGASEWAVGRFTTPAAGAGAGFRLAWTGDTCGQGFGRNPEWGGLRGYSAIRDQAPAFLLHSGDLIYADNPIEAEKQLPDGRVWRNVTNAAVGKVAETLDEFRARFAYNREDDHVAALSAEVPILAQWDDHETHNNWWPGQILDDDRYEVRDASLLAGRARQATFEWTPIAAPTIHRVIHYGPLLDVIVTDLRAWRTPNDDGHGDGAMFGAAQARWFVDAVAASQARWKLIACDQPLALVIEDGPGGARQEGFADAAPAAGGRERELAGILAELAARQVRNVVWVTADVHYAAAHRFDPARATGGPRAAAFTPFWEFVAGPIHAGSFGPNALDPTLGPELVFQWVPRPGTGDLAPWDGLQSFGTIDVARDALTVGLWGLDGTTRYKVEIPYAG
jgi:alkaline phosphatase D